MHPNEYINDMYNYENYLIFPFLNFHSYLNKRMNISCLCNILQIKMTKQRKTKIKIKMMDWLDLKNVFYLPANLIYNLGCKISNRENGYEKMLWSIHDNGEFDYIKERFSWYKGEENGLELFRQQEIPWQTPRYSHFLHSLPLTYLKEHKEQIKEETALELRHYQPLRYYWKEDKKKFSYLSFFSIGISSILFLNKKTYYPYLIFNTLALGTFCGSHSHI